MQVVANAAGVSLRTLYRYYPTREELFAAAAERLLGNMGISQEVPDGDVAAGFLDASAKLSEEPVLARNLVRSTRGTAVRSPNRRPRHVAIADAATSVSLGLTPASAAGAAAVIAHLCSSASWVTICDEAGLGADDARHSVAWAIRTLQSALAEGNGPAILTTTSTAATSTRTPFG